jgi:hypothetical protein
MFNRETLSKREREMPLRITKDQFLGYLAVMKQHLPDLEAKYKLEKTAIIS